MNSFLDTPRPAERRIETAGAAPLEMRPQQTTSESPQGEETGAISVQLTRRIIEGGDR